MKTKATLTILFTVAVTQAASAASATWTGGTSNALWSDTGNWSASPVPGTGDTATFNAAAGSGGSVLDLGSGVSLATLAFDTSAAGYTIGAGGAGVQTLALDNTAAISRTAAVATAQTIDANVVLGTAAAGTTTITNSSTSGTLTFAGAFQGGTGGTAGIKSVNFAAASNTNTALTGPISGGGSTQLNLVNIGAGTLTLSGAVTRSVNILRASANGLVAITGGTTTVAAQSVLGGSSSTYGRIDVQGGSASFNGGIRTNSSIGDGSLVKVSGGSLTATDISIGRTSNSGTSIITSGSVTQGSGFVVTSGAATLSGSLTLGTSNSSATGHISGGDVLIGGVTTLGATTNSRNNILQVSGGTLTSSNATGIVLSAHTSTANLSELYITGGTTTFEAVQFGTATAAAGSSGALVMNGTGTLYVGAGGMAIGSANAYTATVDLRGGTLAAKAAWSSNLNVALNGTATQNIKAADASGTAQNITLGGVVSGANGFTKTGDGRLTLSGTCTYTGATTVSAGTLLVTGALGATDVAVQSTGTVGGSGNLGGNLVFSAGANLDLTGATLGVASTGILTVDATKTITLDGFAFSDIVGWDASAAADGTYTLVNGGSSTALNGSTPTVSNPYAFSATKFGYFQQGSLQAVIYSVSVPEPGTMFLGAVGALGLVRRRKAGRPA